MKGFLHCLPAIFFCIYCAVHYGTLKPELALGKIEFQVSHLSLDRGRKRDLRLGWIPHWLKKFSSQNWAVCARSQSNRASNDLPVQWLWHCIIQLASVTEKDFSSGCFRKNVTFLRAYGCTNKFWDSMNTPVTETASVLVIHSLQRYLIRGRKQKRNGRCYWDQEKDQLLSNAARNMRFLRAVGRVVWSCTWIQTVLVGKKNQWENCFCVLHKPV